MNRSATSLADAAEQALNRGDMATAERASRDAVALEPNNYKCLVFLSHSLRMRGEFEESSAIAERAILLKPAIVEAYFQLALNMLTLGRYPRAADTLKKAIELRPEIGVFHLNLGLAYENLGRRELAERCYRQAANLDGNDLDSRLRHASLMIVQGKIAEGRREIEMILRAAPHSCSTNLVMAELCVAEEGLGKAEPFIRRAIELDPANAAALSMLGFRELEAGRFEEAEGLFRRSLEANPNQGDAYLGLTQTRKITPEDRPMIEQIEHVAKTAVLNPAEAGSIRFALAKAFDNLSDYGSAMGYYDEGHRFAYLAQFGQGAFDETRYQRIIDSVIDLFPQPIAGVGIESRVPILIVGMIRSGTTLTEQILSRHPEVGAAGEHRFWQDQAGTVERLATILEEPSKIAALGQGYVEALHQASPGSSRVTDKYPGNYLRLGLIRSALPKAKIIHCRRSPVDNGLSIYMTPIKSAPVFSHSKEAIVFAYRQYERIMDHWRKTLPAENFLEVQYEELVENPEPIIRQMIDFCGLEWNDDCLTPERNTKDVLTPSLWQVRQPIYKSSVERWRRYEPWLGALRELIQD